MDTFHTLQLLRILATVVALAPLVVLRDAFGVRGRPWRVARHGARLALLAVEAGLLAAWVIATRVAHADRALVPPGIEPWTAALGALLAIGGGWLCAWARRRLGRLFSPTFGVLEDHALVSDGPYGLTRHPLYTGVLALFAGQALLWNSALTLVLAVVLVAPMFVHTVIEERMFTENFGEVYVAYRRRVPRLMPWWPRG
jgi:protein-S-isoprenylcysteine O-methyltransferase Ste14